MNTEVPYVVYIIICAMSLLARTVINRTMKLLALALSVALLFTAGESATDPPLNKHNLCCCATGTSAISCSFYCPGTADLSDTHSTLMLPPMWLHGHLWQLFT